MRLQSSIIEKAKRYIEKNNLSTSPEEMFIDFQKNVSFAY